MFLGLDIGTSGVKAVLVDESQELRAQATAPLTVSRPHAGWSEQDPEDWWRACVRALAELGQRDGVRLDAVRAIGLSGQMHGATLVDARGDVLRPAILWNDGRSAAQCTTLEERAPALREVAGNLAMPGFTAPKFLWVAEHEPDVFARVGKVLLPKDYVRYRLSGAFAGEMSDASGTLWLDVGARTWSAELLEASGLRLSHMPELFEGSATSATLSGEAAAALGLETGIPIAGGGGDNACGAVGMGAVHDGQATLSLGTSGVTFVANDAFRPNPGRAMHAFCHALPDTWHQMSVMLSAASCVQWFADCAGASGPDALSTEIAEQRPQPASVLFLPYLSGERTPHNDPNAKGVFFGLTHETTRAEMGRAVLEGVAFAFADGQDALLGGGAQIGSVSVIGGGSRNPLWAEILASVLQRPLDLPAGGDYGPAFGASRLARLALTGEPADQVCTAPEITRTQEPNAAWVEGYARQLERYRGLYAALADAMAGDRPDP